MGVNGSFTPSCFARAKVRFCQVFTIFIQFLVSKIICNPWGASGSELVALKRCSTPGGSAMQTNGPERNYLSNRNKKRRTAAKLSPLYPKVTALFCCSVSPAALLPFYGAALAGFRSLDRR